MSTKYLAGMGREEERSFGDVCINYSNERSIDSAEFRPYSPAEPWWCGSRRICLSRHIFLALCPFSQGELFQTAQIFPIKGR